VHNKWIVSLVLCALVWCSGNNPAWAALSQSSFIPLASAKQLSSGYRNYTVRPGDNLWDISRSYRVDLQQLMLSNNLNNKSVLRVGQIIKIPTSQGNVHVISQGETLWHIAQRYNVDLNQLKNLNPDKKPNNLKIGDTIYLPGSTSQMALAASSVKPSRSLATRFAWPIKGQITSHYGWRSSGYHHGLDVAGNLGDAVKASTGGVVSFTGAMGLYGNTVIIDHTSSMQTLYAHLHTIKVKEGDRVKQGDVIATVGSTGRSTGPHLHFEIRRDGERFDPLAYLR
jgi:murein DD-endopeptidase MepM/ murein hydrolase activator NlpD